eukprot:s474_g13.t1
MLQLHNFTSLQVNVHEVDTILYLDCTKLGVMTQQNVNALGEMAERILHSPPQRERFCGSTLWMRQVLSDFPVAIQEKEFCVPGGVKNNFATVIVHPTAYDGAVEIASMQHGAWVVATSTSDVQYKSARDAAWKNSQAPMDKQQQKYKKEVAPDDMPKDPKLPALKVCQFQDGRLQIPRDIRQHFMQCPINGPEWRDVIMKFDKDWGTPVTTSSPSPSTPSPPPTTSGANPAESPAVKIEAKLEQDFEWSSVFKDSPSTVAALKQKFGADLTEMAGIGSTSSFYLAPGPQLYFVAKEPIHVKCKESPIISHGAGSWLTGDKAIKFESNTPDRGIPCKLESDLIQCVFEEMGSHKNQVCNTIFLLRHMVDGLPTPPALGGITRDGDETEIDQDNSQDSQCPGLEVPVDDTPGTLKRKLQFDPVECGLEPKDPEFNSEVVEDPMGEENKPEDSDTENKPEDSDTDFNREVESLFGDIHDLDDYQEDTDLFGIPQTDQNEPTAGSFVVPLVKNPSDRDLPPSDAVPVEEMPENLLDDEIEKSSKPLEGGVKPDEKVFKTSEKQRANSRDWHKKWISKGVPRNGVAPKIGKSAKSKISPKAKAKGTTSSKSSSASSPSQPAKTLAQAKDIFIAKWIEGCGMDPSNDRRAAAIKAWMDSVERSDFIAGQKGSQK